MLAYIDGFDFIISVMIVRSRSFAASALLYPDCHRDQGPLMFIGIEMIPLQ